MDDKSVVLTHGKERLHDFLPHLNSIHAIINFTMESKQNKALSSSVVLMSRKIGDSLEYTGKSHILTSP
jgi:hypothetical protein